MDLINDCFYNDAMGYLKYILPTITFTIFFWSIGPVFGLEIKVQKGYPRRILAILTTDDYELAKKTAKEANAQTDIPLNYRELEKYKESDFLTFKESDCLKRFGKYPCYTARGLDDNLVYFSVELSMAYSNLPDSKYVVVALIDFEDSSQLSITAKSLREKYPKAIELPVWIEGNWLSVE